MKRVTSYLWLLIPLIFSPSLRPAHAYIDPTTGSYAIQVAIGFLFGASYALKSFGSRMISRIRKRNPKNPPGA